MSKKMQFDREDYLKANRKLSREEEIKTHGRPVRIGGVHKSKKVYDRKRSKAEMKKALSDLSDVTEECAAMEAGEAQAKVYYRRVVPAMDQLRTPADKLEMIMDKDLWPFPSYGDLIFEV